MKNWIFIFMISLITLPGYGKVKVQKPKMKHPTAFAILVDEVTYEKIPGAIEAYRDAIEKDGLSAYIVSGNWESPDQERRLSPCRGVNPFWKGSFWSGIFRWR